MSLSEGNARSDTRPELSSDAITWDSSPRSPLSAGEGRPPLYHQLKELLRDRIESGEWGPGFKVPSERELCATYSVSRATTTPALNDLERTGLIERRQGKGTFVAQPKLVHNLLGFHSFPSPASNRGLEPVARILSTEVVSPSQRQRQLLHLDAEQQVIRIARLRTVGGEPMLMDVIVIPHALCPGLENEDLETSLLHDLLATRYGITVVEQEKSVEPVILDDYEAGLLQASRGALGLIVERLGFAAGRMPVEFRRMLVPAHRCKYVVEVSRP